MSTPSLVTTRICAALNAAEARYLLMGGGACALHGHVRATCDVDLLIERTIDNARRVLTAIAEAGYTAAADWPPDQLVYKPVTVIGDNPAVNVYAVAWSVKYASAIARATTEEVEGVAIPLIGLDDLIAAKRTGRWQDAADVEALEAIKHHGRPVR